MNARFATWARRACASGHLRRIRASAPAWRLVASLVATASLAGAVSYKATRRVIGLKRRSNDGATVMATKAVSTMPQLAAMSVAIPPDLIASLQAPAKITLEPVAGATSENTYHTEPQPEAQRPQQPTSNAARRDSDRLAPAKPEAKVAMGTKVVRTASTRPDARVREANATQPSKDETLATPNTTGQAEAPRVAREIPPVNRQQLMAAARIVDLEVRGSLVAASVRRAAERIRPALASCYADATHQQGLTALGAAGLRFTIDETGHARDAKINGPTAELNECLRAAIGKLACTAPDTGTVQVAFTVKITS